MGALAPPAPRRGSLWTMATRHGRYYAARMTLGGLVVRTRATRSEAEARSGAARPRIEIFVVLVMYTHGAVLGLFLISKLLFRTRQGGLLSSALAPRPLPPNPQKRNREKMEPRSYRY